MYWSLLLVFPVINVIITLLKININASMSTNILFINSILRSAILYYSVSLKYFSTSFTFVESSGINPFSIANSLIISVCVSSLNLSK